MHPSGLRTNASNACTNVPVHDEKSMTMARYTKSSEYCVRAWWRDGTADWSASTQSSLVDRSKQAKNGVVYLGDAAGDGGGEEGGEADDVDELAEEDEEHRHGGAVRARAHRTHRHQHVVPPVSEREQLQERHLLHRHLLPLRRRLPTAALLVFPGAMHRRAHLLAPQEIEPSAGVSAC